MCAIIGIMATGKNPALTKKQYKAFKKAWVRAEDRGRHAAGFVVNIENELWFGKAEGPASSLVNDLPGFDDGKILWAFAHTRWATHGSPSENINNHPIVTGPDKDLIGIHNGVILNKTRLLAQHSWDPYREVDSEIAFRLLHHYGCESTKALRMINGAANLCYAKHSRPDRFWLTRSGNPLVVKEGEGYRAFGSLAHYWHDLPGKLSTPDDETLMRWTPTGVMSKVIRERKPVENLWDRTPRDPSGRPITSASTFRHARRAMRAGSAEEFTSDLGGGWGIDENGNIVHILN